MGMPVAKKCLLCKNVELYFERIEDYNIHIRDNHIDENEPYLGDAYRCNVCRQYFIDVNKFINHITTSH
jgi:hypothetical protein